MNKLTTTNGKQTTMTKLSTTETEYWNRQGNPLSPSQIEMAAEIAEAHAFDELSSDQIKRSGHLSRYINEVNSLLLTSRDIDLTPSSDEDRLDELLGRLDYQLERVLTQRDFMNTLLTNAGHEIISTDYDHDLVVKFSDGSGQIVNLTWFSR
jgi:hypothetical protein